MSNFWNVYIVIIVVGNLIGYGLLLIGNSRLSAEEAKQDTTGHTFDGIEERNQPLPRWWFIMFLMTIAFAFAYLALYPGLGSYKGALGWTSGGQWEEEVKMAKAHSDPLFKEFAKLPIEELIQYPEPMAVGARLFANNCAICHGSDARGARGYPNLTDDDWLYGGKPEDIVKSITFGRSGTMTPMLQALGGEDAVRDMAIYVQALSSERVANDPQNAGAIERSQPKFALCAACHGPTGEGNQLVGAPNLTDGIWLHSPRREDIEAIIRNGQVSHMPPHEGVLTAEQIHVIAAYVYSLSHSQPEK
ncbi:cytochrome-c oxidase, cbb3-type subunit III [Isoalcanivorax beigongshangi]|uniref:Cbb3-type cytochrome c oxidase subunit n=1 Tax=Isoalcanivorax beigongshangi TaxID=3238810 RepID=A0ABV4AJP7_9GAMM